MYVKRKSNWYIYFIAFGITLVFVFFAIIGFRAYLFPEETENTGLNYKGELTDDFKPTHEHDFSVLAMLSDGFSSTPDFFYMINFNAVEKLLVFVPLPTGISVPKSDGMTLQALYTSYGAEEVVKAVEKAVGIKCESYVKMDRYAFEELVDDFGIIEYNLPRTTVVRDFDSVLSYNSGRQYLTADSIYQLIINAVYDEGELYRFRMAGDMLSELINQNYNDLDSPVLDRYFKIVNEKSESDLTTDKYLKHKAAILNAVVHGISPAEYYIPYGEYTDDGGFLIADNSVYTIKQKAGFEV